MRSSVLLCLFLFAFCLSSSAQGIITTVAGGGLGGDGSLATSAALSTVNDVYVDDTGNIYIVENAKIRKVSAATGIITTLAGDGNPGVGCDSCDATLAKFIGAQAITFDKQGNYYIADNGNHVIRKVDAVTNIITRVVGDWTGGYSGDGGPAKNAKLWFPQDICFDTTGNLYIADQEYVIRKVDGQTGIITTIAGNGMQGTWNNGDTAVKAKLGRIRGIAVDKISDIYFADLDNRKIAKINAQGIISIYCGNGTAGISGDGGPAINATTYSSTKLRFDKNQNLYYSDGYIRRIDWTLGIIERVAGIMAVGFSGDGGPALQATLNGPISTFPDKSNNLFIADQLNYRIRKVTGVVGITTISEPLQFVIYPNPSAGIYSIRSSKNIDKVEIHNIRGQLIYVFQVQANLVQFDLSSQPAGVYLVSVFGKDGKACKKVILSH